MSIKAENFGNKGYPYKTAHPFSFGELRTLSKSILRKHTAGLIRDTQNPIPTLMNSLLLNPKDCFELAGIEIPIDLIWHHGSRCGYFNSVRIPGQSLKVLFS